MGVTYTKETALYDTGAIANSINAVQTNLDETNQDFNEKNQATLDALKGINDALYGENPEESTDDGLQGLINRAIVDIGQLSADYNAIWTNVYSFMKFGEDDNHNPVLTLGSTESRFKVNITNEQVQFIYDGVPIAFLNGNSLRVKEWLSFGNFIMYQRTNGHFTLKYIGTNGGGE